LVSELRLCCKCNWLGSWTTNNSGVLLAVCINCLVCLASKARCYHCHAANISFINLQLINKSLQISIEICTIQVFIWFRSNLIGVVFDFRIINAACIFSILDTWKSNFENYLRSSPILNCFLIISIKLFLVISQTSIFGLIFEQSIQQLSCFKFLLLSLINPVLSHWLGQQSSLHAFCWFENWPVLW
jgi:hypothetical protein